MTAQEGDQPFGSGVCTCFQKQTGKEPDVLIVLSARFVNMSLSKLHESTQLETCSLTGKSGEKAALLGVLDLNIWMPSPKRGACRRHVAVVFFCVCLCLCGVQLLIEASTYRPVWNPAPEDI